MARRVAQRGGCWGKKAGGTGACLRALGRPSGCVRSCGQQAGRPRRTSSMSSVPDLRGMAGAGAKGLPWAAPRPASGVSISTARPVRLCGCLPFEQRPLSAAPRHCDSDRLHRPPPRGRGRCCGIVHGSRTGSAAMHSCFGAVQNIHAGGLRNLRTGRDWIEAQHARNANTGVATEGRRRCRISWGESRRRVRPVSLRPGMRYRGLVFSTSQSMHCWMPLGGSVAVDVEMAVHWRDSPRILRRVDKARAHAAHRRHRGQDRVLVEARRGKSNATCRPTSPWRWRSLHDGASDARRPELTHRRDTCFSARCCGMNRSRRLPAPRVADLRHPAISVPALPPLVARPPPAQRREQQQAP